MSNDSLPSGYVVQIKLGEAAIAAIREFATSNVPTIDQLEADLFRWVHDTRLRRSLAETLFGARWLYHLGLVTLADDVHRAAHVRAQIIDYAAICEAVLIDALTHGVHRGRLSGSKWKCKYNGNAWKADPKWPPATREGINKSIRKERSFYWCIDVAADEKMVKPGLKSELHTLRDQRNKVHIAELAAIGEAASIRTSKDAYRIMHSCVSAVGHWMSLHK